MEIIAHCLGYKFGTGCHKVSKAPKALNWTRHQLCYNCFLEVVMEKKPHKGTGGKYLEKDSDQKGMSLITS